MKILFLLFILASCLKSEVKQLNPIDTYFNPKITAAFDSSNTSEEYLNLLNSYREGLGLAPLISNDDMNLLALLHSEDMANGVVEFGYDGTNERCETLLSAVGNGNLCGEIIAKGPGTPKTVLNAWLATSTQKSKMESPRFTHTGIGIAQDANGVTYWTQIFLEVAE